MWVLRVHVAGPGDGVYGGVAPAAASQRHAAGASYTASEDAVRALVRDAEASDDEAVQAKEKKRPQRLKGGPEEAAGALQPDAQDGEEEEEAQQRPAKQDQGSKAALAAVKEKKEKQEPRQQEKQQRGEPKGAAAVQEEQAAGKQQEQQGAKGKAKEEQQEPEQPEQKQKQQEQKQQDRDAGEQQVATEPSPYQQAVAKCQDIPCLTDAGRLPMHPGQFRFPHFFIVGWQKCATTALFGNLINHPQVLSATIKVRERAPGRRASQSKSRTDQRHPRACQPGCQLSNPAC